MASLLECVGVNLCAGNLPVLKDVSISLPSFGSMAIVGPNGAGKTTLLDVISGLRWPDQGRIVFRGRDITRLPVHARAGLGIARSFQDARLISQISALNNVLLARPSRKREGLWAAISGFPFGREEGTERAAAWECLRLVGLEASSELPAERLSYGQRKLLALACCLAMEPTVLLLDEPVSGIHSDLVKRSMSLIEELSSRGIIVVFVEHNLEFVRQVAGSVVVMDHGTIISSGIPSQVLGLDLVLEAFLG